MDLPTLDFAQFKSNVPEEREELAKALAQSFKDHGFVKLINHGLPEDLVADMLASVSVLRRYGYWKELIDFQVE